MWRRHWTAWWAVLAVVVAGCGGSEETGTTEQSTPQATNPTTNSVGQLEAPAAAVAEFLEAVRGGNDDKVASMLTTIARKKVAESRMVVAPPGSDTAQFTVGQVEYLAEDGARVSCTWSDLDENSRRKTDNVTWMVRREEVGWRIAGVSTPVFDDAPPLLLNFEDPEEMVRKQRWVREEMVRRAQSASIQGQAGENFQESIHR